MGEVDKRGKLDEEPFSYKVSKDKKSLSTGMERWL
jgi:hypothetical protein